MQCMLYYSNGQVKIVAWKWKVVYVCNCIGLKERPYHCGDYKGDYKPIEVEYGE